MIGSTPDPARSTRRPSSFARDDRACPYSAAVEPAAYGLAVEGSTLGTWIGIGVTAAIGTAGVWQGAAANRRAKRLEDVNFERSDVEWEWYFSTETDAWVIHNAGQDTAYEVTATAEVDGSDYVATADAVPRRGELEIDLSDLAPQARTDQTRQWEEALASNFITTPSQSLDIGHRVTWLSKGGRWSSVVLPVQAVDID